MRSKSNILKKEDEIRNKMRFEKLIIIKQTRVKKKDGQNQNKNNLKD
jgi:hypothetical protein